MKMNADMLNTNDKVTEAILFATAAHAGQLRKGTTRPYITHPLEVLTILNGMRADNNLLIAGVLHDTIEDTDTTREDIEALFGPDVAELVAHHSEDKSKSWRERKQATIDEVRTGSKRLKMLILADKLANIRDMCIDYATVEEELWSRFNTGKTEQAWYNNGVIDAMEELQFDPAIKDYYWELNERYKDLFVTNWLDTATWTLYQLDVSGSLHGLQRGDGIWREYTMPLELPESWVGITKEYLQRIEDNWEDEELMLQNQKMN